MEITLALESAGCLTVVKRCFVLFCFPFCQYWNSWPSTAVQELLHYFYCIEIIGHSHVAVLLISFFLFILNHIPLDMRLMKSFKNLTNKSHFVEFLMGISDDYIAPEKIKVWIGWFKIYFSIVLVFHLLVLCLTGLLPRSTKFRYVVKLKSISVGA